LLSHSEHVHMHYTATLSPMSYCLILAILFVNPFGKWQYL